MLLYNNNNNNNDIYTTNNNITTIIISQTLIGLSGGRPACRASPPGRPRQRHTK